MEATVEFHETIENVSISFVEITDNVSIEITETIEVLTIEFQELGVPGVIGMSNYEIAIKNGFIGTEVEWLDSLRENSIPDFIQLTPSNTWIVNHNSGKKRSLELFTVGGCKMVGDIQIISANQTIATFLQPIAGFAKVI